MKSETKTKKTSKKPEKEVEGIMITMPREIFDEASLKRLEQLINCKAELFKRAFQAEEIKIEVDKDTVSFPWFKVDFNCAGYYSEFVSKLCAYAIKSKRIVEKQNPIVNEKYEFRCFLLKLGFIGKEYTETRKYLLKNLKGSSAFKSGAKKESTEC